MARASGARPAESRVSTLPEAASGKGKSVDHRFMGRGKARGIPSDVGRVRRSAPAAAAAEGWGMAASGVCPAPALRGRKKKGAFGPPFPFVDGCARSRNSTRHKKFLPGVAAWLSLPENFCHRSGAERRCSEQHFRELPSRAGRRPGALCNALCSTGDLRPARRLLRRGSAPERRRCSDSRRRYFFRAMTSRSSGTYTPPRKAWRASSE